MKQLMLVEGETHLEGGSPISKRSVNPSPMTTTSAFIFLPIYMNKQMILSRPASQVEIQEMSKMDFGSA